nr:MAG: hypothetical protein CM15mV30_1800 [uncultured marine virus]
MDFLAKVEHLWLHVTIGAGLACSVQEAQLQVSDAITDFINLTLHNQ